MKPGTNVEIETKDKQVIKGLVMNSSDSSMITIKLNSGYNMGINKKNISKIKEIKVKKEDKKVKKEAVEFNKNLKTISVLHCGGTIASKVSYETGAVSPSFSPNDLLMMFPELRSIVNIKSKLITNIFSEDTRFRHYNLIAKEIEKEIKSGVDGIIVTHGTDTLAYSSCALAFILENLSKPVILVGSQRSSDRPSSDAAMNLLCAVQFIAKSDFNDIAICMHSKSEDEYCDILPACKSKKLHSSRRDAFKAVNGNAIAKVNKEGNIEFSQFYKKTPRESLNLRLFKENIKIGILKAHPNLFPEEIRNYSKFNGLIIEGTGLGHLSINKSDNTTKENEDIFNELKKLAKKIPVVMTSQCIFGRVNMNVYDTGRKLQQIGVLGNNSDMTLEATFIKLAWLLSNYKKISDINNLFNKNLRGELSSRSTYEDVFI